MILIVENDPRCPAGLYGKLLRDWRVSHGVWRPYAGETAPPLRRASGVIILGGTLGVFDQSTHPFLARVKAFIHEVLAENLPCLGICLGGQLLAEALGAEVRSGHAGEKGCHTLNLSAAGRKDPLFAGLPDNFPVFHWHNDSFDVPDGAALLASTPDCPAQAIRYGKAWGVQFHPEIDGTIMRDWCEKALDERVLITDFQRRQFSLHLVGEQLLHNFLGVVASCQSALSSRPNPAADRYCHIR